MRRLLGVWPMLVAVACSATVGKPGENPSAVGTLDQAQIDQLIESGWQRAGLTPSPPVDDGEYLRRVTLDVVGRVPWLGEVKVFLADRRPDKRTRLVDRLLGSPEFGEHWADLYANLLWHEEAKRADKENDPRAWFVHAFNENVGYDKITGVILAGRGDLRDRGALTFVTSHLRAGGPESLAASVARVFLGVQIQCAQCHDHPYDPRWKQEDFWGLVAYFSGARVRPEAMGSGKSTLVVTDEGGGLATMPLKGYTEGVAVRPRFLGYRPPERPVDSLRRTFLRATLASDLFPKTMVDRTWAQLFGHGLVDPWDDLGGENDPHHPPLLVKLAEDYRAAGFDTKRLVRQIVLSTAYARSSAPPPGGPDEAGTREVAVRAFARAGVRALSPEQLYRSLVVMTGAELRARHDGKVGAALARGLREYRFVFDDDEMGEASSFDGSVPQALLLWNGELTNDGARVGPDGVIGGILRMRQAPADRLDEMMMATYARRATDEEKALFLETLHDDHAYEDLFFALTTSTEALTNH